MLASFFALAVSRPPPAHVPSSAAGAIFGGVMLIVMLVIAAFVFLVMGFILSRIFAKAGKPALPAYIPIWNIIVLLEICGLPLWWIVLFFIPLANIFAAIYVPAKLNERFGIESPMSFILPIVSLFFPIVGFGVLLYLAFGDSQYRAPNAAPAYA